MKQGIHPQVFKDAKVTCTSCKAVFTIPSTKKDNQIEICSNCHPVYTGKYRGVTSSGRVERFQKKMAAKKEDATNKPKKRKLTPEEKVEKKVKDAKAAKKATPSSAKATAGKPKKPASASASAPSDRGRAGKATRSTGSGQAADKKAPAGKKKKSS